MADREKVIVELTAEIENASHCRHCGLAVTMENALSLLKEQEPIAPKLIKMYPHDIYECGNCGHRSVGSKDYKAKYCPECGQAVKWNEAL